MITSFNSTNYNNRYSLQTTPFGAKSKPVNLRKTLEGFASALPDNKKPEEIIEELEKKISIGSAPEGLNIQNNHINFELPKEAFNISDRNIEKVVLSIKKPEPGVNVPSAQHRILSVSVSRKASWGENQSRQNSQILDVKTIPEIKDSLRKTAAGNSFGETVRKLVRDFDQN